ncbi:MAG: methionine--tRNA ligase [Myxococcota bacterium]|nr:methionine--tRNA ligase [Myxococcota bacterium]
MSQPSPYFVTTPLYYVNDRPHIGHAYTTLAADVLARWNRLLGKNVFFATGTDEHGQKVLDAAKLRNLLPKEHADNMVVPFQQLWKRLGIQYTDFIRTTRDSHTEPVKAVLQHLYEKGEIYEDSYEGWYSKSVERFWTEKDLVDGKCPESGKDVEWIKEQNYFFRMSKYADTLREWIESHPDFLKPDSRRNEVLGYLRKEVGDLCISRPKSRLSWGIPLPFDENFVTYVWFDALLNYITCLGYHPDPEQRDPNFSTFWPATCQIVGKDILTTHAVYWSTMLFALGLEPTNTLFAHGWWTVEGKKMGKSVGNVVDPNLLIDCYGVDALRYFLLKEFPFGADGNFSHDAFLVRYNADLANDFGNLTHRALSMTERWMGGSIPAIGEKTTAEEELEQLAQSVFESYKEHLDNLAFSKALETLWTLVRRGNKYIDTQQPWTLNKNKNTARLGTVMRYSMEICRIAAQLFSPFMPDKSKEVLDRFKLPLSEIEVGHLHTLDALKEGASVKAGKPLFPRQKELPERIQTLLGREKKVQPKAKPKTSSIKIKVFQRVSFRVGTVLSVKKDSQKMHFSIDVGTEEALSISDATLSSQKDFTGSHVVVIGPNQKEDFKKIVLKTAQIKEAAPHPDPEARKLLHLTIDNGEEEQRSVVAGIANAFSPQDLKGQRMTLVSNLKPSKLRGVVSQGMLLAAGGSEIQGLVLAPENIDVGVQLSWFGDGEYGILCVPNQTVMTLSATATPGAVVR